MQSAVNAAFLYFISVFALGFVLGAARVLFVVPRIGEVGAVVLEVPIMLGASWVICGLLVRRLNVPPMITARLIMGGLAFTQLMLAEAGVSVFAFGRTIAEHGAAYLMPAAQAGLAAQLLFAAMPLILLRTERSTRK